jgi:uncharacterized protein YoxC
MATMYFAMWLQDADQNSTRHLITIAIEVMAVAVALMSVVMLVILVKVFRTVREVGETVQEVKGKVMPVLDEVMEISKTSRELLQDAAPKVKIISENLVKTSETLAETSKMARSAARQVELTVADANMRAQRQVARVDGMVTAALVTTAEVAETIANGIKGPAQKVAVLVNHARVVAEGLLSKVRSMAANTSFGKRPRPE